jgi:hypothetical protein
MSSQLQPAVETPPQSVLQMAYIAWQRGDVVGAREILRKFAAVEPSDVDVLESHALAQLLSTSTESITNEPRAVAAALEARLKVPNRVFRFALACGLALIFFAVLAGLRSA